MNDFKALAKILFLSAFLMVSQEAEALTPPSRAAKPSRGLAKICRKIQSLNPSVMFWKNNKPLRASSAIDAPVIGYYKQMTLAYAAGNRGILGTVLYDSNGQTLSSMIPNPCRPDHCGGRVVSSMQTDATRRLAISRTRNPRGYISIGRRVCVEIPDIGRCLGNSVNKSRALCNTTVG